MTLLALAVLLPPGTAVASSNPSQWPAGRGAEPNLSATPDTVRFAGPDRYGTNVALDLALRGKGGFPFDTSDPTSGNAAGLAQADGWWGAASCPRSVIVVAGDTFADALAATSLSDPNDRSTQPRLQRVAAADPSFDPIGGFGRPDTAYAPIVVTQSARSGATALAASARMTASDLATGGCTSAREAIIVGGRDAVPVGAESELVKLGYREVFRVAGADRYETAARVATALGTSAPAPGAACVDGNAADGGTRMGWYGNAVPEYRFDAHSCRLLSRAVVLADGDTGADALAAGWWTSYWQVPVLLTGPDGGLPPATSAELRTLDVDTVIVLGGVDRIPERTVDEARSLASAVVGRIAGADRTATSIEMAKAFGGWFPTGNGADFADDRACFAASGGSGAAAQGWPDALAAGPICGRLAAAGTPSPARALPPVTGPQAATAATGGKTPSHDAAPVILLPDGQGQLPASVADFFQAAFTPEAPWCSADEAGAGCIGSGFGVLIGGASTIPEPVADSLTALLSGGNASDLGDRTPRLTDPFVTSLDLSPRYRTFGLGGPPSVCLPPGGAADLRWLSLSADATRRQFVGELDLLRTGRDVSPEGTCFDLGPDAQSFAASGVSLSGRVTDPVTFRPEAARHLSLSQAVAQDGDHASGGDNHWSFAGPPDGVEVRLGDEHQVLSRATLDLDFTVGPSGRDAAVSGSFTLTTSFGGLQGSVRAQATLDGGTWEIEGQASTGPFADGTRRGGFMASLDTAGAPAATVTWDLDGY